MSIRIPRIALILIAAVGLVGGAVGATLVLTDDQAATDTTATTDTNQRLADQYSRTDGGSNLANICRQIPIIGEPRAERLAERILGSQIIREGGSPSEVAADLIGKC